MSDFLNNFHFLRPLWLLAFFLLIAILYALYCWPKQYNPWRAHCDAELLAFLQQDSKDKRQWWQLAGLALLWSLCILTLAGPSWRRLPQPVYDNSSARVIALDLSQAMDAKDISPSRLARAKFKITDLLQQMPIGSTALLAFTDEAYVVSPLTRDDNTLLHLLSVLQPSIMPANGNDLSAAITLSQQLLENAHQHQGDVILITAATPDSKAFKAAKLLQERGYSLHILGIGTEQGAPIPGNAGFAMDAQGRVRFSQLDIGELRALAKQGGGHYYSVVDSGDTDTLKISQEVKKQQHITSLAQRQQVNALWADEGYWLLFLVLPGVLLLFRRGQLE